jgi:hypothetical protein
MTRLERPISRLLRGKTHTLLPGNTAGEVLVQPFGLDQLWKLSNAELSRLNDLLFSHNRTPRKLQAE